MDLYVASQPNVSNRLPRGERNARTDCQGLTKRSNPGATTPGFELFVEAPGIENDQRQLADTIGRGKGPIGVDADPADVSGRASKCAIDGGDVTESSDAYELSNVVETALARALVLAAEARRWDVVLQIAEELEARRSGTPQAQHRAKPS
ncbi:MAG TPA: hypothetical protein VFQ61_20010 [Polyangiaceae bacterium]|nr:hypothetical protein [Polyangiaceae bacterium]